MEKSLMQINDNDYFVFYPDLEEFLINNKESLKDSFVSNLLSIYKQPIGLNFKEYQKFVCETLGEIDGDSWFLLFMIMLLFTLLFVHFDLNILTALTFSIFILIFMFVVFCFTLRNEAMTFSYSVQHFKQLRMLNLFYGYLKCRFSTKSRNAIFIELMKSKPHHSIFETLSNIDEISEVEKLIGLNFPQDTLEHFKKMGKKETERSKALLILQGNLKTLNILLSNENEIQNQIDEKLEKLKMSKNIFEIEKFNKDVESLILSASRMSLSGDILKFLK